MTSLTEVTEESAKHPKAPRKKIDSVDITLADKPSHSPVRSATEAIAFTYEALINGNKDMAEKLTKKTSYFKKNIPNTNSIFRTFREVKVGKDIYYLATSTDFNYKTKQVQTICEILRMNGIEPIVTWSYKENIVLNSADLR